jgi:hypothetical protein
LFWGEILFQSKEKQIMAKPALDAEELPTHPSAKKVSSHKHGKKKGKGKKKKSRKRMAK